MITLILSLIGFVFFACYAGYCNCIMDMINPLDSFKSRGKGWSYADFVAPKTGWFEKMFPKDKWHWHKDKMIISNGLSTGAWLLFSGCVVPLNLFAPVWLLSVIVLQPLLFGCSFALFWKVLRKKYPNQR